ncbi:hypothetical protein SYJ56_22805 [Algoriphagus sp. D3-2-R+10]|uniref:hypothetical protein n=1 Tax=Algoriphagus aurantiacus TaxID=3103948 RepID=UPI002B3BECC4|nr:hypothetical protein [Algoriphagus sp. D3-2-R+10]MEB2778158.1 hypothetical protein [Algoriphagus sp. D3-2-R+10]
MKDSNKKEFDQRDSAHIKVESEPIARRYFSRIYFGTLRKGDDPMKTEKVVGYLDKNNIK